jgi:TfoX/Sxy family transcriptional regulator of competence genes
MEKFSKKAATGLTLPYKEVQQQITQAKPSEENLSKNYKKIKNKRPQQKVVRIKKQKDKNKQLQT